MQCRVNEPFNQEAIISDIAGRIRYTRKLRGLSQSQLAKRIGVSVQAISQWERGKSGISVEKIQAIAEAAGVDPNWLFNGPQTKTTFNEYVGDLNRVPILHLDEVFMFGGLGVIGKVRDISGQIEILTDREFKGAGFGVYILNDDYPGEFPLGDLLIFDTELEHTPDDVVIVSVVYMSAAAPTLNEGRSFKTALCRVFKMDEEKPFDPQNVGLRHLNATLMEDIRNGEQVRAYLHGTLVERRTYPRISEETIRNLMSWIKHPFSVDRS